ncbi:MAG: hypothetical protein ACPKM0_05500 [Pleomorphochaeta sp.]
MKKKVFAFIAVLAICISSVYADLDYKFDLVSFDPLHKEYFADRTSPEFSLNYLTYLEGFPTYIMQDEYIRDETEVNKINIWEFDEIIQPEDKMVHLKLGETLSVARSTFSFDSILSPISFDFSMQGLLQEFFLGGFDDSFGYDGIYFFGGTFRIGDFLSMRIGRQHYCSHYGDIIFKRIKRSSDPSYSEFWITYKYVRMDNYAIGLSIDPTPYLRLYGELKYPPKNIKSVRPDMFAPNWVVRDGVTINPDYPDSYNARIVNLGIEVEYPIFKKFGLGNTTIGYDLYLYEEGKVQYELVNGGSIYFDEDAQWEREHNLIAQELNDVISIEVTYHNGRSPFNNMYYQHTEIIGVAARFNPKSSVTLFDTK